MVAALVKRFVKELVERIVPYHRHSLTDTDVVRSKADGDPGRTCK
jgi:hypothetical protein